MTVAPLWAGIVLQWRQVRVAGWPSSCPSRLVTERAARLFAVNGGYRAETDKEWCGSGSGPTSKDWRRRAARRGPPLAQHWPSLPSRKLGVVVENRPGPAVD